MNASSFSIIFHRLRVEAGYSMRQMAGLLDVSKTIIGAWEAGRKDPSLANLIAIAEFFDATLDWLVGRDNQDIVPYVPEGENR